MAINCLDNWEDDWENTDIPDLILNLQDTIKNKERELKLLEERKLIEEADMVLADDLFNKNEDKKILIKDLAPVKIIKKEKPKDIKILQEKKRQEQQEKQKQQSQNQKAKKKLEQRLKEIYGEANIDEYDEMYGSIADKY